MAVFVIVLFSTVVIYSLIEWAANRKWTLLCTVFGYERYFMIISRLKEEGIKYKTNTPVGAARSRDAQIMLKDYTQYDIYVRKGQEDKAAHALGRSAI
ncbi:hypothetical protein [Anoxybacteroides tepidamans]|uniref:hypothetical protein n=1 Tax=Anoxybacteroides tepidamans TaxID=265948 RepID=UPI000554BDCC|nr:hypothetical protein [Anoxybacillus tepidamans]